MDMEMEMEMDCDVMQRDGMGWNVMQCAFWVSDEICKINQDGYGL